MKDLNKEEWLLIKRSDYIDLLEGAKKEDISFEIFQAFYEWLESNNKINEIDETH